MIRTPATISPRPVSFMRRRYSPRVRRSRAVMGSVPLLDLVLLLGAFAWLNSMWTLRPALPLELPATAFTSGVPSDFVILTVTAEGWVFFQDQRLPRDQWATQLETARRREQVSDLVIQADRRVTQETLIELYELARTAGYRTVWWATRPGARREGP